MTLKEQILAALAANPDGYTANEMAAMFGRTNATVCGRCTTMMTANLVHVGGWRTGKGTRPCGVYRLGKRPPGFKLERPFKEERTRRIITSLTPTEHQLIHNAAKAKGIHPATYMRRIAMEAARA